MKIGILYEVSEDSEEYPGENLDDTATRKKRKRPKLDREEVHAALAPYRTLLAQAIASAQDAGEFSGIDPTEDAELIHMVMMSRYQLLAEGVKPERSRPPEEPFPRRRVR